MTSLRAGLRSLSQIMQTPTLPLRRHHRRLPRATPVPPLVVQFAYNTDVVKATAAVTISNPLYEKPELSDKVREISEIEGVGRRVETLQREDTTSELSSGAQFKEPLVSPMHEKG